MAEVRVTGLRRDLFKGEALNDPSAFFNQEIDLYGFSVVSATFDQQTGYVDLEILPADENSSKIEPSWMRHDVQRMLDTSRETNRHLNEELTTVRYQLNDTKRLLDRERNNYGASRKGYHDQLNERANDINELKDRLSKQEAAYEKLENLRYCAVTDLRRMEKERAELKKEFADAVARHKQAEREWRAERATLKNQLDDAVNRHQSAKRERDQLREENKQQADHRFADERRQLEQENEHQRKTVAELRERLSEVRVELRTAKKKAALYATSLWQARKAHETSETSIKERVYAALFEDRQVKPDDDQ